jgi:hypothetical protein
MIDVVRTLAAHDSAQADENAARLSLAGARRVLGVGTLLPGLCGVEAR